MLTARLGPFEITRFSHLDIIALSPTNAWLAGSDGNHALVYRWNGKRWRHVAGPPPEAIDAALYLTGARTLWLAGSEIKKVRGQPATFPSYLMRNDGAGWKPAPPPIRESDDSFTLYAVGNETWATTESDEGVLRLICRR